MPWFNHCCEWEVNMVCKKLNPEIVVKHHTLVDFNRHVHVFCCVISSLSKTNQNTIFRNATNCFRPVGWPSDTVKGLSFEKRLSFIEQDKHLVSTSGGRVLRTWKLGEYVPEVRLKEIPGNVVSLSCSPDESNYFLRTEQGIQIWDVETGQKKD